MTDQPAPDAMTALGFPADDPLRRDAAMVKLFMRSGLFQDLRDVAVGLVQVMAGRELGIGPFQAINGIDVIKGRPELSAALKGALMKRGGYDWTIEKNDAEGCIIHVRRDGQQLGTASFTMQDAQAAGLAGGNNWKRYAADMMFARAISRAQRQFAPEVTMAAMYVSGEVGGEESRDDDYVVQTEPVVSTAPVVEVEQVAVVDAEVVEDDLKAALQASVDQQQDDGADEEEETLDDALASQPSVLAAQYTESHRDEKITLGLFPDDAPQLLQPAMKLYCRDLRNAGHRLTHADTWSIVQKAATARKVSLDVVEKDSSFKLAVAFINELREELSQEVAV